MGQSIRNFTPQSYSDWLGINQSSVSWGDDWQAVDELKWWYGRYWFIIWNTKLILFEFNAKSITFRPLKFIIFLLERAVSSARYAAAHNCNLRRVGGPCANIVIFQWKNLHILYWRIMAESSFSIEESWCIFKSAPIRHLPYWYGAANRVLIQRPKMHELCVKNHEITFEMMNLVLKMMNFVFKTASRVERPSPWRSC